MLLSGQFKAFCGGDYMDESAQKIIDWLKGLPKNTVVKWGADCMNNKQPWGRRWVDINVPEINKALNLNWMWTIESVGRDEEEDPDICDIAVPFDLDIHTACESGGPEEFKSFSVLRGTSLSLEQKGELDRLVNDGEGERMIYTEGGWSSEAISAALQQWVVTHANRPDIQFTWNPDAPESAILQEARAIAEEVTEGAKTYDLGDGVRASEQMMDTLLEDPNTAAHIIEKIKAIKKSKE